MGRKTPFCCTISPATWSKFASPANQHPNSTIKKKKAHVPLRTSWISPQMCLPCLIIIQSRNERNVIKECMTHLLTDFYSQLYKLIRSSVACVQNFITLPGCTSEGVRGVVPPLSERWACRHRWASAKGDGLDPALCFTVSVRLRATSGTHSARHDGIRTHSEKKVKPANGSWLRTCSTKFSIFSEL